MSNKHPIFAITGSSGAGTSTVRDAMEHIFRREGFKVAVVEGDCFHRYGRDEMRRHEVAAESEGRHFSHFGPQANHFEKLEELFREYGKSGTGEHRHYLHNELEANAYDQVPGTFTPWERLPEDTDLLFYEGLHGGVQNEEIDVAQYVDLLIGVVPTVNLEWIQKLHRDTSIRGYSREAVTDVILRRMHDYVHYVTPQFSRTNINFQRVPMVDTSNPFIARYVPSLDESMIVIRFRDPKKLNVDFAYLLSMLHDSMMSRRNTLVVPGGKMGFAMEIIMQPLIQSMVNDGVVAYR